MPHNTQAKGEAERATGQAPSLKKNNPTQPSALTRTASLARTSGQRRRMAATAALIRQQAARLLRRSRASGRTKSTGGRAVTARAHVHSTGAIEVLDIDTGSWQVAALRDSKTPSQRRAQRLRAWRQRLRQQAPRLSTVAPLHRETTAPRQPGCRQVDLQLGPQVVQVSIEARPASASEAGVGSQRQDQGELRAYSPEQSQDLDAIADKIARILPLIYWDWQRRGELVGETVVRFRIEPQGYVDRSRVVQTSGDRRIDQDSHLALLMASPYQPDAGWYEVRLRFRG